MNFQLISESLKFGFQNSLKHFFLFFKTFVLIMVVFIIFSLILALTGSSLGSEEEMALAIVSGAITPIIYIIFMATFQAIYTLGLTRISLNIVDGKPVSVKNLFGEIRLIPKFALAGLCIFFAIAGMGFLIMAPVAFVATLINFEFLKSIIMIPAIVFVIFATLRIKFYLFVILDKNSGPIVSLKESARITKGHVTVLLVWSVIMMLLNLAGVLLLLIGLLLTIPWIMITDAYIYRKLSGAAPAPSPPAAAPPPQPETPLVVPG